MTSMLGDSEWFSVTTNRPSMRLWTAILRRAMASCVQPSKLVLLDLCEMVTGQRPSSPRGAVDRLRNAEALDGSEAELLKGLVGVSNERGGTPRT